MYYVLRQNLAMSVASFRDASGNITSLTTLKLFNHEYYSFLLKKFTSLIKIKTSLFSVQNGSSFFLADICVESIA